MNILFYLVPKSEVMYLYDDYSLRQAMEKMEYHKYGAVPIINRAGNYVGTLTEGDILWELKDRKLTNLHEAEEIMLRHINRKRDNEPVNVNCNIEDLVMTSMNQNFVPVIDDNGIFIGIVTRKSIIEYCYKQYKAVSSAQAGVEKVTEL
ncbi:MAG: CBS domain-containing protein [Lachnospiraceae bacterium]|nr:CBS domain-containing protein [Lachnospiraceae bacterium]